MVPVGLIFWDWHHLILEKCITQTNVNFIWFFSLNCLFAVDTVASLCGVPLRADALGIDAIYTGSQKVLSVPPGLAPISFSDKAVAKILARKSPTISNCLDINWLGQYWNCFEDKGHVYQHTGPINLMYALREGLAILAEEGLEVSFSSCRRNLIKTFNI